MVILKWGPLGVTPLALQILGKTLDFLITVITRFFRAFQKLIGDLKELQRDYGDEKRGAKR